MEAKKTPKADLESKRTLFVQIGLIVALAAMLVAFEWKTYDIKQVDLGGRQAEKVEEDLVEITNQNKPPPPPAPPPTTTLINIVQNDVEVEDDLNIDAEATELTEIPEYTPIASTEEEEVAEAEIFTVVEESPSFPGGDEARIRFLTDNIKYPQIARESSIQGTVYVTFVVEKNGNVTDVRILRGIGGGCDEEAVRVIKAMPKWNPG
ncbi:MAG: energy transducer TonB, partial [Lentimicrobium sp.]|nr:energy transducer TonB [Lentimicrobium sp.]